MSLDKISFIQINAKKHENYVLFGAGNIATKTLRRINHSKVKFIVDNSTNLQGTKFADLEVRNPNDIKKGSLIIICSSAIADISAQLEEMNLVPNVDFVISPVLNDLIAIDELESLEQIIYFTSGTVPNKEYGGGLYKVHINGANIGTERIYVGPCYGAIRRGDEVIFVDTDHGVKGYHTKTGVIRELGSTPVGSRAHGISYNQDNNRFYVTCSYLDSVIEYTEDFIEIRHFNLSDKIDYYGEPMHHCNDNLAIGNSLYVTMFSSTGNWKRDAFDGCVAEIDLITGERLTDVTRNLFMPHNILAFDGSLHVLDSLPGHLRAFNFSIQGTFPAFTRGLAYSNGLYYIGQSKNRNFSKVLGLSNNISIDCGIIVWHPEKKVSRFIPQSMKIGEIHSIVI